MMTAVAAGPYGPATPIASNLQANNTSNNRAGQTNGGGGAKKQLEPIRLGVGGVVKSGNSGGGATNGVNGSSAGSSSVSSPSISASPDNASSKKVNYFISS